MKAIILCAGRGERLMPLTATIPKPMIPINNKPVLEYLMMLCKKHGINEIAINTSYLPEKIKEYFSDGKKLGVKIRYSFEKELLGTSGALNNFRDFFNETFFVIYGDNVTDIDLTKMLEFHKEKGGIATLALRKKPKDYKTQSLIILDRNMRVSQFYEKPSEEMVNQLAKEFKWINSGIYALEPVVFEFIPPGFSDFAYDIFPKILSANKKIMGFDMNDCYFREIGKVDKYELVKKELESGQFKLSYAMNNKKNRAVFLDKDGTVNENLYEVDGILMAPATIEQIKILPNVKEGIAEMKKQGFKIILGTNQPGFAFGYINPKKFTEMAEYLKKELGIDEVYYCPHHPSKGKVKEFVKECNCRKPLPGLIFNAAEDFDIDIETSYIVGDSLSDIQTGKNAKVKKTFLIGIIREDVLAIQHRKGIFPDYTCRDLFEVAKKIREIDA